MSSMVFGDQKMAKVKMAKTMMAKTMMAKTMMAKTMMAKVKMAKVKMAKTKMTKMTKTQDYRDHYSTPRKGARLHEGVVTGSHHHLVTPFVLSTTTLLRLAATKPALSNITKPEHDFMREL